MSGGGSQRLARAVGNSHTPLAARPARGWCSQGMWSAPRQVRAASPGLSLSPAQPSPARAADQGPAPCFCEPKPYQAEPKPGFLSQAEPCKSLGGSAAVIVDTDAREVDPLCVDVHKQGRAQLRSLT